MAAAIWRVEFDRAAARDLRKLGADAERRVLRYLRERIAGSDDPRRFGHALTGDRKGLWRYRVSGFAHCCRHRRRPVRGAGGNRRSPP
jgi:mRNA interferase RelE/StbE